jgi:hypothetical protein
MNADWHQQTDIGFRNVCLPTAALPIEWIGDFGKSPIDRQMFCRLNPFSKAVCIKLLTLHFLFERQRMKKGGGTVEQWE